MNCHYRWGLVLVGLGSGLWGLPARGQEFDFTPGAGTGIPVMPVVPPGSGNLPAPPSLPTFTPENNGPTGAGIAPALGGIDLPVAGDPLPEQPLPIVPVGRPPDQTAYTYVRPGGVTPGIPQSEVVRGELPRGTVLPLTVYREITFQPYQAISGQMEIASPVIDRYGQVVVPAGSVVWGTFEPVYEEQNVERDRGEDPSWQRRIVGSRFVANRITISQATYLVQGQSEFMPMGFDPQADLGTVALRGAGYGAAGGIALGVMTGGVGFLPVMAGGLIGATAGTTNVDRVITLRPNFVLGVELSDDLILQ